MIIKAFGVGLIAVSACFALSISGKVTDTSGSPIVGASVKLEINGQTAISGTDGKFTLGSVALKDQFPQSKQCRFSVRIANGFLLVDLREKVSVDVITYNLQGREMSAIRKSMDVGLNSIALPYYGSGVFLYMVKSGNMEFMLKSNSVSQFLQGKAVSEKGSVLNNSLAKQMKVTTAINDVITVTKNGYLNYRCVMYNSDTTGVEIKMIVCADTVRDIDGNLYQAVRIGNQVWTVENLRVTKYNDGTEIPLVMRNMDWYGIYYNKSKTPAYCYYNNTSNTDSIKKFGALYNWYAVNTKELAPTGWHVPSDSEWTVLEKYLVLHGYSYDGTIDTSKDNKIAKSIAQKTDWQAYPTAGTTGSELSLNNSSGFSASPGIRPVNGAFSNFSLYGFLWSTTMNDESYAYCRYLNHDNANLGRTIQIKSCGFQVRLVRNN